MGSRNQSKLAFEMDAFIKASDQDIPKMRFEHLRITEQVRLLRRETRDAWMEGSRQDPLTAST